MIRVVRCPDLVGECQEWKWNANEKLCSPLKLPLNAIVSGLELAAADFDLTQRRINHKLRKNRVNHHIT